MLPALLLPQPSLVENSGAYACMVRRDKWSSDRSTPGPWSCNRHLSYLTRPEPAARYQGSHRPAGG
jgi:hypothetical protein